MTDCKAIISISNAALHDVIFHALAAQVSKNEHVRRPPSKLTVVWRTVLTRYECHVTNGRSIHRPHDNCHTTGEVRNVKFLND